MESPSPAIRTDLLFDELSDGVCIADKAGEIIYINPAARRLLDLKTPSERPLNVCGLLCGSLYIEGRDFASLCPLRAEGCASSSTTAQGRHGPHEAIEWAGGRIARADRWRHLRVRCLRVTSPLWTLGVEERHLVLIEDASAAVELAERKEDWRRMVAHDIRSPLANVLGTLKLLEEVPAGRALEPAEAELVGSAARACLRMIELLNLFLDVEELDEGGDSPTKAPVPLGSLARRMKDELAARAAEKRLRVELSGEPDAAGIGDSSLLERVLENLLDNAVKFSLEGGTIRVRWGPAENGRVELSVKDEGPGIAPEDLPFVFDRFYQAEARRGGRTRGNGLGLTFCRQAMAAMGGEIEARSRPGAGAEFVLRLPAADPKEGRT